MNNPRVLLLTLSERTSAKGVPFPEWLARSRNRRRVQGRAGPVRQPDVGHLRSRTPAPARARR